MTDAVVTRIGSETWAVGTPAARVTRAGMEVWFSIVPASVVTRIGREVWFPVAHSTGRPKRRLAVISSE